VERISDGAGQPRQQYPWRQLTAWQGEGANRQVMITEGQARPWEAVTVPPNSANAAMYSCLPEDVIGNYNRAMRCSVRAGLNCTAYLFWGAEYWLLPQADGDPRYLDAFAKVLAQR
jgi:hypothetical protein